MSTVRPPKLAALALGGATAMTVLLCQSAADATSAAAQTTSVAKCVASGTDQLNVSYTSTGEASVKVAAKLLSAKYPGLKVNTILSSASSYTQEAQQIIADKAAGEPIDVAQIGNDQISLFVDTYHLKPFSARLLPSTYNKKYLPIGKVNGALYAVPFQLSVPAMYINTQAFKQAGIKNPPTTLDQALADAIKLKPATGDKDTIGLSGGPSTDDWFIQAFIQSYGGQFISKDNRAVFDNPAAIKALSFYTTGIKDKVLYYTTNTNNLVADFVSGKLPIMFQSSAYPPYLTSQIGNRFPWTASFMPTTATPSYTAGGNSLVAMASGACPLAVSDAFITEMVQPKALLPSLLTNSYEPVNTAVLKTLRTSPTTNPKSKALLNITATVTPRATWPGTTTPHIQQIIANMMTRVVDGANLAKQLKLGEMQANEVIAS